eukprot:5661057-Pleurochrysis_carterae.AAC.1
MQSVPRAVPQFLGVCLDPKEYILLCALCEGGSLSHRHFYARQARKPPLSTAALVHQATTIAEGMEYLHERNIMHRDLKSQNILIGADNELKISDFGLAKFAPTEKAELTAETGSYRWMAPEVLRHERYDKSCDVYSYAIVCWEMLTYQVPFADLGPVQVKRRRHDATVLTRARLHCSPRKRRLDAATLAPRPLSLRAH